MKTIVLCIACLLLLVLLSMQGCESTEDDRLAMAIYHAEGGDKAKYPFGIRSVHCDSFSDCKNICEKTIRNNRYRFAQDGHKRYRSYLEYLADRYCPSHGRKNAQAEHDAWLKNVKFFLQDAWLNKSRRSQYAKR